MPAADAPPGTEPDSPSPRGAWGLVGVLAVLPFLPSIAGDFVWDDWQRVARNPHLVPGALAGFWAGDAALLDGISRASMYNPLGWTLHILEVFLAGGARPPALFHATNLLIHGACAAAVYQLIRSLAPVLSWRSATVAAVTASWMPVLGETAGWISGRLDGLTAWLAVGGAAIAARAAGWRGAALGGAILGSSLFAKESGGALVVGLPVLALIWRRDRRTVAFGVAAVGVLVVAAGIRASAGIGVEGGLAALEPARMVPAFLALIELTVVPVWAPSVLRPLPLAVSAASVGVLLALGTALGLALGRGGPARRVVVAGVAWVALGALPNALAATRYELLPDRYAAVAAVGVGLLIAGALVVRPARQHAGAALVALAAVGLLAPRSGAQCLRFTDDVAFFGWEVERWPDAPQAWFFLGDVLATQGRHEEAETALLRAVALAPALPQTWHRLATARYAAGDLDGARSAVEEGLRVLPNEPGLGALRAAWSAAGD